MLLLMNALNFKLLLVLKYSWLCWYRLGFVASWPEHLWLFFDITSLLEGRGCRMNLFNCCRSNYYIIIIHYSLLSILVRTYSYRFDLYTSFVCSTKSSAWIFQLDDGIITIAIVSSMVWWYVWWYIITISFRKNDLGGVRLKKLFLFPTPGSRIVYGLFPWWD